MFDGKNILITGGTGSFGQAFIRHLLSHHKPRRVAVYSRDELKQYDMQQEFNGPEMRYFIGDVRDRVRLTITLCGAGAAGAYQLREPPSSYDADFGIENGPIEPENSFEWRQICL